MVPDSLLFIVYQHLTSTNAQMYQGKARTVPHSCQDVELKQEETHPFKPTNKTLPKTQQIRALSACVTKVKGSCSFFLIMFKKVVPYQIVHFLINVDAKLSVRLLATKLSGCQTVRCKIVLSPFCKIFVPHKQVFWFKTNVSSLFFINL